MGRKAQCQNVSLAASSLVFMAACLLARFLLKATLCAVIFAMIIQRADASETCQFARRVTPRT